MSLHFKDQDVLCFMGDSITSTGVWMAEVLQTIRKTAHVRCINCGIGGITATRYLDILYEYALPCNPDYAFIMFGTNDIGGNLYDDNLKVTAELEEERSARIAQCLESIDKIAQQCLAFGAKPIFCTPIPTDEFHDLDTLQRHRNVALAKVAAGVRRLAGKYQAPLVDFFALMMLYVQTKPLIKEDHTHCLDLGHHYMAQIFMTELGIVPYPAFNAPFAFEDWNRQRWETEHELKMLDQVEYNALFVFSRSGEHKTLAEKKAELMKRYEEYPGPKTDFQPTAALNYCEKIDFRYEFMAEYIRLGG